MHTQKCCGFKTEKASVHFFVLIWPAGRFNSVKVNAASLTVLCRPPPTDPPIQPPSTCPWVHLQPCRKKTFQSTITSFFPLLFLLYHCALEALKDSFTYYVPPFQQPDPSDLWLPHKKPNCQGEAGLAHANCFEDLLMNIAYNVVFQCNARHPPVSILVKWNLFQFIKLHLER